MGLKKEIKINYCQTVFQLNVFYAFKRKKVFQKVVKNMIFLRY